MNGSDGFAMSGLRAKRQARTYHMTIAAVRSYSPAMKKTAARAPNVRIAATTVGESLSESTFGKRYRREPAAAGSTPRFEKISSVHGRSAAKWTKR
jgi:hypothetical protein